MEKQFIPYEQALELKGLGFKNNWNFKEYDTMGYLQHTGLLDSHKLEAIDAPLWQQAFRFFREKYGLHYIICKNIQMDGYGYREVILISYMEENENTIFKTYEEAEVECLVKLIEIAKEQNVK